MMDFRLSAEQATFQAEVQSCIDVGLPDSWGEEHDSLDARLAIEREVMLRLAAQRWLALPWPKEYGGFGASPMMQLLFNEAMAYNRVPGTTNMGVAWVGPVVMMYGSEAQREAYLRGIADGSQLWCTLYSEPGAGSDLTSLQTRAVREGDEYITNGQKIWTTFGHYADWGWVAARTDPDAPKHRGISTFAVKMDSPGMTVTPLTNMAGAHEFNEIFFENVHVPASQLVGEENRGWYNVAVGLDFERSSIGATSAARRNVDDLVAFLRGREVPTTDSTRFEAAEHAIGVQLLRNMAYYVASQQEKTGVAPTRESQMAKRFGAELQQRIASTSLKALGMEAVGTRGSSYAADIQYIFLRATANTVEGGTSEVQRTVIATRGLGLPRE